MQRYSAQGLTDTQVEQSRQLHGSNELTQKNNNSFLRQLLSNFGDPIIKVLLSALAINVVFLFRSHDYFESIGIAIAVLLATFVSTLSEYGSEAAFEKLQEEAGDIQCRVYRNGKLCSLGIDQIVVGDIVSLQSGERVPADGVMVHGSLQVDQSALNGESQEAEKHATQDQHTPSLTSPRHVFRGSVVTNGNGCMQVTAVGIHTIYGEVVDELQDETRESPLKVRLEKLAETLSRIGYVAAILVGFADIFYNVVVINQYEWSRIISCLQNTPQMINLLLHSLTLAITVLVVAVPEGLPMMITVVLSSNMKRLLSQHVLVRKLVGIETSGSLTMLFTDKTGTITEGKPKVSVFISANGTEHVQSNTLKIHKKLWRYIRNSCLYNNDSTYSGGECFGGNTTDRALLQYIYDRRPFPTSGQTIKQLTFNSNRKWSAAEVYDTKTRHLTTYYKGAPDRLLPLCTEYMTEEGDIRPLETDCNDLVTRLENKAMRVVLLAISNDKTISETPQSLTLLGLIGLRDDVRPDVRKAVTTVKTAGIQTIMVTGDSKKTATVIARSAGLFRNKAEEENAIITGEELASLNDVQVKQRLPALAVVARALPGDKSRLVRLAQESGHVVGMTGDGVNDAPAMKKADVGFAMGSGTEVAKQAGDIVILNDNFASIANAILFGRTIFKSIRKFIVFQLTMNFCAVGVSVLGPFIGIDTPVTVMQMLWVNIIMDTLAGLAFAGEPPLPEYMAEPPKRRNEPILNRYMLSQILSTGIFTIALSTVFLVCDWPKSLFRYQSHPIYWMTAFFTFFIFCGVCNSFNARTTRLNLLSHLYNNFGFVIIMIIVTGIQLLLVYYGGSLFRAAPLKPNELLTVFLIAALVIPFDILRKCVLRLCHRHGTL